ncbi:MAG: Fur family transcriptional regulator [Candidatus Porifericomitaceae bacterium WSBS_2022_MAG_OTU9]
MDTNRQHYRRLLSERNIYPTAQRLFIASFVLRKHQHLSAEQIFTAIGSMRNGKQLSKATVYNTLNLFTSKGLLREVDVGVGKTYFDSNTSNHHHFYNVKTRKITDISAAEMQYTLPELPANTELDSTCICVNIKPTE